MYENGDVSETWMNGSHVANLWTYGFVLWFCAFQVWLLKDFVVDEKMTGATC